LIGKSGFKWGVALIGSKKSNDPIYISIGHKISIETAVIIVKACC
jgi:deoxyribonuclease V